MYQIKSISFENGKMFKLSKESKKRKTILSPCTRRKQRLGIIRRQQKYSVRSILALPTEVELIKTVRCFL